MYHPLSSANARVMLESVSLEDASVFPTIISPINILLSQWLPAVPEPPSSSRSAPSSSSHPNVS